MNKFLFVFISLCFFGQQVQSTTKLLTSNVKELNGDLHPKHRHLSEEGQLNLRIAGRGYFQFRLPVTLTDASGDESQKRRLNTLKEKDDTCSSDGECKSNYCDTSIQISVCSCKVDGTKLSTINYDATKCCNNFAFQYMGYMGANSIHNVCATTKRPVDDSSCYVDDDATTEASNTRQCPQNLFCSQIRKATSTNTQPQATDYHKRCDCACYDEAGNRYTSSKYYATTSIERKYVATTFGTQESVGYSIIQFKSAFAQTSDEKFPGDDTTSASSICSHGIYGMDAWVKGAMKLNQYRTFGNTVVNGNDDLQYCIDDRVGVKTLGEPSSNGGNVCDPTKSCYSDASTYVLLDGYNKANSNAGTACRERCPGTIKFSDCPEDVMKGSINSYDSEGAEFSGSCPLATIDSGYHFKDIPEKKGIFILNNVVESNSGGNHDIPIRYEYDATTMDNQVIIQQGKCCTIEICDINGENCFGEQPEPPAATPAAAETPKQCNNDCPTCDSANSCIESPNSCNWKPIDTSEGDCVSAATYDEAYAASPPPNNTQVSGGLPDKGDGTNSVEATDDGDGDDKTISEVVYGKDGSLHVNKFGYLVDDNGFLLVSESRNTNDENAKFHIHIPSRADDLIVTPTGKILAMELGGGSINKVGQLKIVRFENAQGLNVRLQMKSNCYAAGESGFNLGNWCQGSILDGKDHTYMSETEVSGPGIVGNPGDQGFGRVLKSK